MKINFLMMRAPVMLVAFVCANVIGASVVSAVTIGGNRITAQTRVSGEAVVDEQYLVTGTPSNYYLDRTESADHYIRVQSDYSETEGVATIYNGLDMARTGVRGDFVQAYSTYLEFTVDEDTTYSASGRLDVTDVSGSGKVHFRSYLYEHSGRGLVFESLQKSEDTINESFVLGELGGDERNVMTGSLEGNLKTGHTYWWFWEVVDGSTTWDGGNSAVGNFTLNIGGGTGGASPLPDHGSTALMMGLALFGLRWVKRR